MPVPNIGLQRARDLVRGSGSMNAPVNSLGFGTSNAAEAAADTVLGAGAASSYWKTTGDSSWLDTAGGDGTADPWWQKEVTWTETEISAGGEVALFEMGSAAGALTGTNPAGEDGTKLYTRKRVGGAGGIGKTDDIQLSNRTRVTY